MTIPPTTFVPCTAPPPGTRERWAWDYVTTTNLESKLAIPTFPDAWEEGAPARRIDAPGRPTELRVVPKSKKTPSLEALRHPERRAQLLHTFLHHELQAAELMCWALLAFPDTPSPWKRGLLGICKDEIRHMAMYRKELAKVGIAYGDLPVNDWFWMRIPTASSPAAFAAAMGIGFEGGNLDHAERFAARFEDVGDTEGAAIQRVVGDEEIAHVAFAVHWFREFTGGLDFDTWCAHLPAPLSPMVMRGSPQNRRARERAGLDAAFLERLAAWTPA
ncbi:MAG: DUF455 family protein [Polyangiaceae bacterium]